MTRQTILRALAALAVVAAGSAFLARRATVPPAPPPEPVRLGLALQPSDGLMIVAERLGYLARAGLAAQVHRYPSGRRALDEGLLDGQVDIAGCADVPLAQAGLAGRALRVLAQVAHSSNLNRIVARRDSGIRGLADLRGRRIGTQGDSAAHYFLYLILADHGLAESDIDLRRLPAEALAPALAAGTIDAFSMREPYVTQARDLLGDQALTLSAPGLYPQSEVLVARADWLAAHPETARRLMRALAAARDWLRANPGPAQDLIAAALGLAPGALADEWADLRLGLSLPQSLLPALERLAAWTAGRAPPGPQPERGPATTPPDFLDLIAPQALEAVDPAAVTYIH